MDALASLQFGFAPALATALLHSLWQDALLAIAAACALAAMGRSSAASRHAVAMVFLVAMVAVPAFTFAGFWHQAPARINDGWLPAITAPQLDKASGVFAQQSNPITSVLALLWFAGVGLMLLRRFGGWRVLASLDRQPLERLPDEWLQRVDVLRRALGIARTVTVRLSADVLTPFTARLVRPVIWLPLSLLTQLPREQVEALLAHELAHIARMDWLWNGLQCVIEALLFFHPAAWWLGRRIRIEREHACDDRAVAACGDAIALAEALAQLERRRAPTPRLVLAAQGGSLMKRITRLLPATTSRSQWGTRVGATLLLVAGGFVAAQLAFGSARPSIHITATTEGPLRAGDSREITANGIDKKRYYRADVDAQGRVTEVYREDGVAKPIDAGVQRWVADVVRLSTPPAPPAPPAPPPPPPAPADIPPPPAPPAPPEVTDTAVFKSLVERVAADAGLRARLGQPITLASRELHGDLNIGPDDANADVRMELRGPKGHATVHVVAEREGGPWSVDTVDIIGPVR